MKTQPPRTGQDRRAIHAYCTDAAHGTWHSTAAHHGLSVSAIIEALAPRLDAMLTTDPTLVAAARKVDASRRRRTR